jgi:heme/copper-type cytochrome/quinol oxidase subunit 2
MWRVYALGFGLMAVVMVVAGIVLFAVTLMNPPAGAAAPEWVLLLRAAVAVVLGIVAGALSTLAWRQARRPSL